MEWRSSIQQRAMPATAGEELERLIAVMRRLRAPDGCPWDRAQSLRSLRPYLVEEAYEVLDALDSGQPSHLREELGDLLFQIVFQSQISEEQGVFGMSDVIHGLAAKLEFRHPNVFQGRPAMPAQEAHRSWAALKREERLVAGQAAPSALDGVPRQAPALLRAERTGEKAARVGFDWPDLAGVRAKVAEEAGELDRAILSGDRGAVERELGDLLFSLCNLARWLETPAEDALRAAVDRFAARFHFIERALSAEGRQVAQSSAEDLDRLWRAAKVDVG
jgi:ATP diphosphatase